MNSEACAARDDAIVKAGLHNVPHTKLCDLEAAVDASLRAKLSTLSAALKHRAKYELDNYRSAGRCLHELMVNSYKTTQVMAFIAMGAQKDLEDKPWLLD